MELTFAIILVLLGAIFFIVGLYEERMKSQGGDDQEEKDYFVIIFLSVATGCLILGGIIFLAPTESYYSVTSDSLEFYNLRDYWPYAWFFIGWGILSLLLTAGKAFERLGAGETE